MWNDRHKTFVAIASVVLTAFLMRGIVSRGGPYFSPPATVMEHVDVAHHPTRDALLLLPRVRPYLPPGAQVTCFRPLNGVAQRDGNAYVASGLLPQQTIESPYAASLALDRAQLVEYVIAVGEPFTHPAYRLVATFPEGRLYRVQR